MTLNAALVDGLTRLALVLPDDAQSKLIEYTNLIGKWNRVYNLTAIREPGKVLTHHILDSLAVAPHVSAHALLDVGSGAGLPGIPLALALPKAQVTLLDSNQKKCAFLNQAVIELKLDNVKVVCARIEDWQTDQRFDLVISRAFSELAKFVASTARLCAPGGTLLAMKGVEPLAEIEQLPNQFHLSHVTPLKVPGLDAQRHLVFMRAA
jgi:16S rRNA (guanine527-N7)-methyltransferase